MANPNEDDLRVAKEGNNELVSKWFSLITELYPEFAEKFIQTVKTYKQGVRDGMSKAALIAERSHHQPCICTTCLIHAEIAAAIRAGNESQAGEKE